MLAISLDRYRAVIFPLRPRLTMNSAAVVIAVTWILAMLVSLPVAIFNKVVPVLPASDVNMTGGGGGGGGRCLEEWPGGETQRRAYSMAVMILQYFLPLTILTFTYANIGVVIWAKKVPGEAENSRDQRIAASKKKVLNFVLSSENRQ